MSATAHYLIELVGHIFLGIVQGLAEIVPISSSAHLGLARTFLEEQLDFHGFTFSAVSFLRLGTFVAILAFYLKDILHFWHTAKQSLFHPQETTWANAERWLQPIGILLSLGVTALVGLALRPVAHQAFDQPLALAVLLILNGLILGATARYPLGHRRFNELQLRHYLFIGLCQGIAVIPGISRLGATLCAGLICGLGWFEALKLSFLLALPIMLGASVVMGLDAQAAGTFADLNSLGLLIGIIVSASTAYGAMRLLQRHRLHAHDKLSNFAGYCILTGLFAGTFFVLLA